MKGLYCQAQGGAEPTFILEETSVPAQLSDHHVRVQVKTCVLRPVDHQLLGDIGIQKPLTPVGREVAGVVLKVGSKVSFFQPDDEVVGILPLDHSCSGLCDVIDIEQHYLVAKPQSLGWECAAALQDGLTAYTALHTHARMAAGHTLLVLDGAHPVGLLCVQLACSHGLKVLAAAHTPEDYRLLDQLRPPTVRVVPLYEADCDLLSVVMEETGGLGLDILLDFGVRLQEEEPAPQGGFLPHKHDVILMLGVGGHWVTSQSDLQLDPPDSRLLFLKSACLSFLNPQVWTCSSAQQGRYLHILKDIVEKLAAGVLRPLPEDAVPLCDAAVVMETVQRQEKRKAVVQL